MVSLTSRLLTLLALGALPCSQAAFSLKPITYMKQLRVGAFVSGSEPQSNSASAQSEVVHGYCRGIVIGSMVKWLDETNNEDRKWKVLEIDYDAQSVRMQESRKLLITSSDLQVRENIRCRRLQLLSTLTAGHFVVLQGFTHPEHLYLNGMYAKITRGSGAPIYGYTLQIGSGGPKRSDLDMFAEKLMPVSQMTPPKRLRVDLLDGGLPAPSSQSGASRTSGLMSMSSSIEADGILEAVRGIYEYKQRVSDGKPTWRLRVDMDLYYEIHCDDGWKISEVRTTEDLDQVRVSLFFLARHEDASDTRDYVSPRSVYYPHWIVDDRIQWYAYADLGTAGWDRPAPARIQVQETEDLLDDNFAPDDSFDLIEIRRIEGLAPKWTSMYGIYAREPDDVSKGPAWKKRWPRTGADVDLDVYIYRSPRGDRWRIGRKEDFLTENCFAYRPGSAHPADENGGDQTGWREASGYGNGNEFAWLEGPRVRFELVPRPEPGSFVMGDTVEMLGLTTENDEGLNGERAKISGHISGTDEYKVAIEIQGGIKFTRLFPRKNLKLVGTYKEGDMVELANLQAQDWNGKVGTLLQWLGGERRWKVRVDVDDPDFRGDGGDHSVVKNIKEENFRAAAFVCRATDSSQQVSPLHGPDPSAMTQEEEELQYAINLSLAESGSSPSRKTPVSDIEIKNVDEGSSSYPTFVYGIYFRQPYDFNDGPVWKKPGTKIDVLIFKSECGGRWEIRVADAHTKHWRGGCLAYRPLSGSSHPAEGGDRTVWVVKHILDSGSSDLRGINVPFELTSIDYCKKGHKLERCADPYGKGLCGVVCDCCDQHLWPCADTVLHCNECKYDLCDLCLQSQRDESLVKWSGENTTVAEGRETFSAEPQPQTAAAGEQVGESTSTTPVNAQEVSDAEPQAKTAGKADESATPAEAQEVPAADQQAKTAGRADEITTLAGRQEASRVEPETTAAGEAGENMIPGERQEASAPEPQATAAGEPNENTNPAEPEDEEAFATEPRPKVGTKADDNTMPANVHDVPPESGEELRAQAAGDGEADENNMTLAGRQEVSAAEPEARGARGAGENMRPAPAEGRDAQSAGELQVEVAGEADEKAVPAEGQDPSVEEPQGRAEGDGQADESTSPAGEQEATAAGAQAQAKAVDETGGTGTLAEGQEACARAAEPQAGAAGEACENTISAEGLAAGAPERQPAAAGEADENTIAAEPGQEASAAEVGDKCEPAGKAGTDTIIAEGQKGSAAEPGPKVSGAAGKSSIIIIPAKRDAPAAEPQAVDVREADETQNAILAVGQEASAAATHVQAVGEASENNTISAEQGDEASAAETHAEAADDAGKIYTISAEGQEARVAETDGPGEPLRIQSLDNARQEPLTHSARDESLLAYADQPEDIAAGSPTSASTALTPAGDDVDCQSDSKEASGEAILACDEVSEGKNDHEVAITFIMTIPRIPNISQKEIAALKTFLSAPNQLNRQFPGLISGSAENTSSASEYNFVQQPHRVDKNVWEPSQTVVTKSNVTGLQNFSERMEEALGILNRVIANIDQLPEEDISKVPESQSGCDAEVGSSGGSGEISRNNMSSTSEIKLRLTRLYEVLERQHSSLSKSLALFMEGREPDGGDTRELIISANDDDGQAWTFNILIPCLIVSCLAALLGVVGFVWCKCFRKSVGRSNDLSATRSLQIDNNNMRIVRSSSVGGAVIAVRSPAEEISRAPSMDHLLASPDHSEDSSGDDASNLSSSSSELIVDVHKLSIVSKSTRSCESYEKGRFASLTTTSSLYCPDISNDPLLKNGSDSSCRRQSSRRKNARIMTSMSRPGSRNLFGRSLHSSSQLSIQHEAQDEVPPEQKRFPPDSSRSHDLFPYQPGSQFSGNKSLHPHGSSSYNSRSRPLAPVDENTSLRFISDDDENEPPSQSDDVAQEASNQSDVESVIQGGPRFLHIAGEQYDIHELLGRGGFGEVYRVTIDSKLPNLNCSEAAVRRDSANGNVQTEKHLEHSHAAFALKVVKARTQREFESVQGEVKIMERLAGHPRIIQIRASQEIWQTSSIIIIMELATCDFKQRLKARRQNGNPLNLAEICRYWGQMVDAVAVVHNEGIVHFDLKAENFLCVGENIKLSDFGLAAGVRQDQSHISRHGPAGTVKYMAPEAIYQVGQKGSLKLKFAVDIWSMGLILYEMFYSRGPYDSIMEEHGTRAMFYIADSQLVIQYPDCPRLHSHSLSSSSGGSQVSTSETKGASEKVEEIPNPDADSTATQNKPIIIECQQEFYHMVAVLQHCLQRDPEVRIEVQDIQREMQKLPPVVRTALLFHSSVEGIISDVHPRRTSGLSNQKMDTIIKTNSTEGLQLLDKDSPNTDCGCSYVFSKPHLIPSLSSSGEEVVEMSSIERGTSTREMNSQEQECSGQSENAIMQNNIDQLLRMPTMELADANAEATVLLDACAESSHAKRRQDILDCCADLEQQAGQEEDIRALKERIANLMKTLI